MESGRNVSIFAIRDDKSLSPSPEPVEEVERLDIIAIDNAVVGEGVVPCSDLVTLTSKKLWWILPVGLIGRIKGNKSSIQQDES